MRSIGIAIAAVLTSGAANAAILNIEFDASVAEIFHDGASVSTGVLGAVGDGFSVQLTYDTDLGTDLSYPGADVREGYDGNSPITSLSIGIGENPVGILPAVYSYIRVARGRIAQYNFCDSNSANPGLDLSLVLQRSTDIPGSLDSGFTFAGNSSSTLLVNHLPDFSYEVYSISDGTLSATPNSGGDTPAVSLPAGGLLLVTGLFAMGATKKLRCRGTAPARSAWP